MVRNILLILAIIIVGGFFRFFKLSDYPVGLDHDEISQLVDTAAISETGKDIYGNFLPLTFLSTGDYKVGHYIYISIPFYRLFGNKEVTIRMPAAFFGTLTILAVLLFVKNLTKNWTLSLLSSLMVAITPSEIFYSRKSFENVIGVCLDFFGLYFLLKAINSKRFLWGFVGIFFLAGAMYVYTSQTIIVPLILFLFLTNKGIRIIGRKTFLKFLAFWVILIIPLILITLTNPDLRFRATSVFISQDPNLGRQIEITGSPLKSYIDYTFTRFLNQFNPVYLFANGLDLTNQGFIGMGPLLFWQLPFLILGIVFLFRDEKLSISKKILPALAFIAIIPSAITFEEYSPHRAMLSFTIMSIISAFGLHWFIKTIFDYRNLGEKIKFGVIFIVFLALIANVIYFVRIYSVSFPFEKSHKIQYPFEEVTRFIWSEYNNYDKIVFDPQFGEINPIIGVGAHYYLIFYGNYPLSKFQNESRIGSKPRELLFDKFSIRQVYWPVDKDMKNTLLIASLWSIPIETIDKSKIIKRFDFYDGHPAFYAIKL